MPAKNEFSAVFDKLSGILKKHEKHFLSISASSGTSYSKGSLSGVSHPIHPIAVTSDSLALLLRAMSSATTFDEGSEISPINR